MLTLLTVVEEQESNPVFISQLLFQINTAECLTETTKNIRSEFAFQDWNIWQMYKG